MSDRHLQPEPILHPSARALPWWQPGSARLPGVQPLEDDGWIAPDAAYAPQMALRRQLLQHEPDAVLAALPNARAAADELLGDALERLGALPDFDVGSDTVACPDGARVTVDRDRPLATLGRLVQEDFCILEKQGARHVLVGAVLCFPAGWTLDEKIGRPLDALHGPVAVYDARLAARVQRLFDGVRPGRPLWRVNALGCDAFELFAPRREADPRIAPSESPAFVRSEFQTLRRLARSGAVIFSIHTSVLARSGLSDEDLGQLAVHAAKMHA